MIQFVKGLFCEILFKKEKNYEVSFNQPKFFLAFLEYLFFFVCVYDFRHTTSPFLWFIIKILAALSLSDWFLLTRLVQLLCLLLLIYQILSYLIKPLSLIIKDLVFLLIGIYFTQKFFANFKLYISGCLRNWNYQQASFETLWKFGLCSWQEVI